MTERIVPQYRLEAPHILVCKCITCGMIHEFRDDKIDKDQDPVCPHCCGPMLLVRIK